MTGHRPFKSLTRSAGPSKGDRYVWSIGTGHLTPEHVVDVLVTRVARDGTWADIVCTDADDKTWTKRQRLPFPSGMTRKAKDHAPEDQ